MIAILNWLTSLRVILDLADRWPWLRRLVAWVRGWLHDDTDEAGA